MPRTRGPTMCPPPWLEANLFLDTLSEKEQDSFETGKQNVIGLFDRNWRQCGKSSKSRRKIMFNLKFYTWQNISQIWGTFRNVRSLPFLHNDCYTSLFSVANTALGKFYCKEVYFGSQFSSKVEGLHWVTDGFLAGRVLKQHRAAYGESVPLVSLLLMKLPAFKHGDLSWSPDWSVCPKTQLLNSTARVPAIASPWETGPAWLLEEDTGHFPLENCGVVVPQVR